MKDTILWLQLQPRKKSDGNDLYSSIKDISQWIERNSTLKTGERARLYFQLLVEVNDLELPVHERLVFLEQLHAPVLAIIDKLSKKYAGSGLPLAEDKSKFVEVVNTFWSEMAKGYKIIIDDLSESSFLTAFITHKDLTSALYYVLYYLNSQLYSNYMLYSDCNENVWRDIHQVYRFAAKRNLTNKVPKNHLSTELTIAQLYKKMLLFSLANPYHLSTIEMESVWSHLDEWSQYTQVNLDTAQVLKNEYPFIIKPYSDQSPFSNHNHGNSEKITEFDLSDFTSDSIWGLETKKLVKHLSKKNKYPEISAYLLERLLRAWMGHNLRKLPRNELIEPVVIALGASCISQFLSQIDIVPKILKIAEDEENQELESTTSVYSFYQAYLIDESKKGIRLKLSHQSKKAISPNMGEIIAVKHADDSIKVGYLRWMKESPEGEVEFGIEYLSAMAEPVQLSKGSDISLHKENQTEKSTVLDSFVFPGGREHQFKPILFTHTFIEKFYNSRTDHLVLTHKTGSINIKLVQKVDEVLDYSLYLFEKVDKEQLSEEKKRKKSQQFEKLWNKI